MRILKSKVPNYGRTKKHVEFSSQKSIENFKFLKFHLSKNQFYNITNSTLFVAKFNFFTDF